MAAGNSRIAFGLFGGSKTWIASTDITILVLIYHWELTPHIIEFKGSMPVKC